MTSTTHDINEIKRRMQGASSVLKTELSGLRTGRASAHLLDPVMVEAYGAQMPLNQVATVSVPGPRMISVNVWDRSLVHATEKAIVNSNLGLSPATEGQTIRLRIPELNEDRRKELVKIATYAETARVAVRHVRRVRWTSSKTRKITRSAKTTTIVFATSRRRRMPASRKSSRRQKEISRSGVAPMPEAEVRKRPAAFEVPRHVLLLWMATGVGRRRAVSTRRGTGGGRGTVGRSVPARSALNSSRFSFSAESWSR